MDDMATNEELTQEVADLRHELNLIDHVMMRYAENLDLINAKLGLSIEQVVATRGAMNGLRGERGPH